MFIYVMHLVVFLFLLKSIEQNIFPGSYCNHYFLQMLAHIGRGYYGAAYDAGQFFHY